MDSTVYLVTSSQERHNQRIVDILRLREFFGKMVLVTRTGTIEDEEHLVVGAFPNPTGVLRLVGLHRLKTTFDRYLFFPSRNVLYVKLAKKKLRSVLSAVNAVALFIRTRTRSNSRKRLSALSVFTSTANTSNG